ncbi:MAG: tetratricopeptide repeat protein [Flavobacteriales bacterium]
MKNRVLLIVFLVMCTNICAAGNALVDSLKQRLETEKSDTLKIQILNRLAFSLMYTDNKTAEKYGRRAVKLAETCRYPEHQGDAYYHLGVVYAVRDSSEVAWLLGLKAVKKYKLAKNKYNLTKAYNLLGNLATTSGDYPLALRYFLASLKLDRATGNPANAVGAYINLGNLFAQQNLYSRAREYYQLAEGAMIKSGDSSNLALDWSNIGLTLLYDKFRDSALIYFTKAEKLALRNGDLYTQSLVYNNVALIYEYQAKYKEAIDAHLKSVKIAETFGDKEGIAINYNNLAISYRRIGDLIRSIDYASRSLAISKISGSLREQQVSYFELYQTFFKMGDYKSSLQHHVKYSTIKDSLLNESRSEQLTEMETKYETEKTEKELLEQTVKLEKNEAENRTHRSQRFIFVLAIISALVIALVAVFAFINKRRDNRQIQLQKAEVERKNSEIQLQSDIISEKNKDILDSIKYAKRIQEAILPPDAFFSELKADSFILYMPKDIVSGDFYWIDEKDGKIYFAAVDCTGHGVPGAFISIIGHSGLNRCMNEFNLRKPADILNKLNVLVNETLRQQRSESSVRDGMDIAICCIDTNTMALEYAGANNPLWIIKANGGITEIRADKQPIGTFLEEQNAPFTNHVVKLEKNDSVYIFTDGFADQFGGPKGKKYKYSNMQRLFLGCAGMKLPEIQRKLKTEFENWKGDLEQVDDVCVIGIRM